MTDRNFAERALHALTRRGFQKARVRLADSEQHELQAEFGHTNLLRTTHNVELGLLGIVDDRQGTLSLNDCTDAALGDAVDELWSITNGSKPDSANDIAEAQPSGRFTSGPAEADVDRMYERLDETLTYARDRHPKLRMGQTGLSFMRRHTWFLNSNGVDFETIRGLYYANFMFTARDGTDVSSFNGTGFTLGDLDRPLVSHGTLATLLRQSEDQVRTTKVPTKFAGDLLITPDCLGDFFGFFVGNIGNAPMIAGTSLYKNKCGETVAAPLLTLHSRPRELVGGYSITGDGYEAQNATILDRGVLRTYLLDLYGARKTGLERSVTAGGAFVVEPGETPLADIIRDIRVGVMITRFSGGRPNEKGDFSGIAKNSYYIEHGVIRFPISETMVSGNMAELLHNVVAVSCERADFGSGLYPWVRVGGIGIS